MPALISLAIYAVISLIAFILYFADKKKAQNNKWRIKEATLLGFGFFGGAIGALLGMKIFRHQQMGHLGNVTHHAVSIDAIRRSIGISG